MHGRAVLVFVLLALLLFRTVAQLWLNSLNCKEARRWRAAAPPWLEHTVPEETRRKSVDYSIAKGKVSYFEILFDAVLLGAVAFSGVLPWFDRVVSQRLGQGVAASALYVVLVGVVLSVPSLPLDAWIQFGVEARFGFNRTTVRLWVIDRLKGFILGLLLGYPLLVVVLSLVKWAGRFWWLHGFGVVMAFQLLMLVLFPRLILPLFNKLEPLAEGPLRDRLTALAQRCGFRVASLQVMDGSKRSLHSNAFFTGIGRFRRIVLFDTLIASLTESQIEAVLAHEIGHSKKGHVAKTLVLSGAATLVGFWVLGLLIERAWLYEAFGFDQQRVAPLFVLIGLLGGVVTFWLTPLGNALSRKHEYEADAFAREQLETPVPLVEALGKLAESNLSNLTPHRWYSRFYYSHPTWTERRAALLSGFPAGPTRSSAR